MRELMLDPLLQRIVKFIQSLSLTQAVAAAVAGAVAQFIKTNLDAYLALVALVVIDQITGVAVAWKARKMSSSQFRRGLTKLFVYTVWVAAFFIIEKVDPVFESLQLDTFAIIYLGVTELLSVLENTQLFYPSIRLPGWVATLLKHFQKSR